MFYWRFGRALLVTLALVTLLIAASVVTALAADPTPGASGPLIDPLDPRAGAGPNQTGAPLLALVAVIGIGSLAALATAVYVRATRTR